MRQLSDKGWTHDRNNGARHLAQLTETHESALLDTLSRYPEVVEAAALEQEPHALAQYLRGLANDFHTYYNAHQFLVDDTGLRDARVSLCLATRQVIRNGLDLLGVSAPEAM
jgi:arginyl-tRNA synthetase